MRIRLAVRDRDFDAVVAPCVSGLRGRDRGDDVIIFDHGFSAYHRLIELGIPATRVMHAFLSHLHYDHCGDYPRLLLTPSHVVAGSNSINQARERVIHEMSAAVRLRGQVDSGSDGINQYGYDIR